METNNSHRTAIPRVRMSTPARVLWDEGLIVGRVLDYGCGRSADATHFRNNGVDAHEYDPYYAPEEPQGEFDVILCTYVLNVIEDYDKRQAVLTRIADLLTPSGTAYVTVRRDLARSGRTACGTWQGWIVLTAPAHIAIWRSSAFVTYRLDQHELRFTQPRAMMQAA